mgnify:CR=1 FL=1
MTNEFEEKKKNFMFIPQFSLIHLRHRYIFESNSSSSLKCTDREIERERKKKQNTKIIHSLINSSSSSLYNVRACLFECINRIIKKKHTEKHSKTLHFAQKSNEKFSFSTI